MKQKKYNMTQSQANLLVIDRFLKDMDEWDQEQVDDILSFYSPSVSNINDFKQFLLSHSDEALADLLDSMLDDIASEDGFGTEQQCDPRGDFRNGQWSMWNVEGND